MLQIKVSDQIKVFDNLKEAKRYVVSVMRKWYKSDDEKPLVIEVEKVEERGPPALEINVNEEVITETAFG